MKRYMSLAERRADRESHERDLQRPDRFSPLRHMFAADVPCAGPASHRCIVELEFKDNVHTHRARCTCGWRGLPVAIGQHETARQEGTRHVTTHELFEPTVRVRGVDR